MFGALIGDICGSVYEFNNHKTSDLDEIELITPDSQYTDDSVLTLAVADACLNKHDYGAGIKEWGRKYPNAGYGGMFRRWLHSEDTAPYNSFGNGSAMRVSPVGWAFSTLEEVLREAERSAAVTHNHPEGIKGAQATAAAVFMARNGESKDAIRSYTETAFGYDLSRSVCEIRPFYRFDETCQGTVPESMTVFLESQNFEHALRLAISLGGDTDTIACIVGGIAEAFYKDVPEYLAKFAWAKLTPPMRDVAERFHGRFVINC